MKISKIFAHEIFDSRGLPTIECVVVLEDEIYVTASVPSGASRGRYEAVELRDGGDRLGGKGVTKAIEHIHSTIAPALIGKEPDFIKMDEILLDLDGTENKSNLGANAILATSMAVCRAQAMLAEVELYEFLAMICDYESVSIPFPLVNMINGGLHAHNGLLFQEFLVMPLGGTNFKSSFEAVMLVFYTLKDLLIKQGKSIGVGDEGGFACQFTDEQQALDLLMEAIAFSNIPPEITMVLGIDVAASHFYDYEKKHYSWKGNYVLAQELMEFYEKIITKYPIYYLEDPLCEVDEAAWQQLMQLCGEKIQIVGDDLFVTNMQRIVHGLEHSLANGTIIKPNQIGTITQTLQAIRLAKNNEMHVVVSHRSGETNDDFIADLAIGTSAGQIKVGGCCRGERMAKYNRILAIEDQLMHDLLD